MNEISLPGRDSRATEIYDLLRESIMSGELAPNERLREEQLARVVSASRTPVREALLRLEREGLVRHTSRGIVVTDYTADELSELCVVREALEGLSARLAATNRSETALVLIQAAIDEYAREVDGGELADIIDANHAFHDAIWEASQNHYLMRQLELLRGLIERMDTTTLDTSDRQREALSEHAAIAEAIETRDAARAESLTLEHFKKATALRVMHKRNLLRNARRSKADTFLELREDAVRPP